MSELGGNGIEEPEPTEGVEPEEEEGVFIVYVCVTHKVALLCCEEFVFYS